MLQTQTYSQVLNMAFCLPLHERKQLIKDLRAACSLDEFGDMVAKDLGKRYGLNDIREAK